MLEQYLDGKQFNQEAHDFLTGEIVQTIKNDILLMKTFFQAFEDLSQWKLIKQKGTSKAFYKPEKGIKTYSYQRMQLDSKTISIASQCIIETPIFNPLAMFAEIDNYDKWMPAVSKGSQIGKISMFRSIIHAQIKFPLFFSNRDYMALGSGHVDQEHKAVLFTIQSIKAKKCFGFEIPDPVKHVRMDLNIAVLGLQFLDNNKCRFRSLMNVNPRIKLIPQALINWGIRQVVFEFLKILNKKAINLQEIYQKRIRENEGGKYTQIQKRLSDLLQQDVKIPFLEEQ